MKRLKIIQRSLSRIKRRYLNSNFILSIKFYSKIVLLFVTAALVVRILSPYYETVGNLFINQGWKRVPQHYSFRFVPSLSTTSGCS